MPDIIDELAGLDDDALSKKVGLDAKLKEAREGLAEMQALTGDARKTAVERVEKMFAPHVYPDEFKWIAESAKQKTVCGKDAMATCSPCSC